MYRKILTDGSHEGVLKPDNLFALCLYKNLFPRDYELLEEDRGLIHDVIRDKRAIRRRTGERGESGVAGENEAAPCQRGSIADMLGEYGIDAILPEKYDGGHDGDPRPPCTDGDGGTEHDAATHGSQIRYLRFLILHGYIDENYYEYVAKNRSGLSEGELNLVCRIRAREEVAFDSDVRHLDRFIDELTDDDFGTRYVMIGPILRHVDRVRELSRINKDRKFSNLVGFFRNEGNGSTVGEIIGRMMKGSEPDQFRRFLEEIAREGAAGEGARFPSVFYEALTNGGRNSDVLASALMEDLYQSSDDGSGHRDRDRGLLADYVSQKDDCTKIIDEASVQDKKKLVDLLRLKAGRLCEAPDSPELQRYIIDKGYYVISVDNLKTALGNPAPADGDAFLKKNYGIVKRCKPVKKYIDANMDVYIGDVWLNTALTCEDESEDDVAHLLAVGSDKEGVLEKYGRKFTRVRRNQAQIYAFMLEHDAYVKSWPNILRIFNALGYDGMKEYLYRNPEKIIEQNTGLRGDLVRICDSFVAVLLGDEGSGQEIFKKLPVKYALRELDEKKLLRRYPQGIIKLIKADKTVYSSGDLKYVCADSELLAEYVARHNADINRDFDVFFADFISSFDATSHVDEGEGFAESVRQSRKNLAYVIGKDGIGFEIKHRLISEIEKVGDIDIKRYERRYADYIIRNSKAIMRESSPAELDVLWKFKDWRLVYIDRGKNTYDRKFAALAALGFGLEGQDGDDAENLMNGNMSGYLAKLSGYLSTCCGLYNRMFESGCDLELVDTEDNRRFLGILSACGVVGYSECEGRETLMVHVN